PQRRARCRQRVRGDDPVDHEHAGHLPLPGDDVRAGAGVHLRPLRRDQHLRRHLVLRADPGDAEVHARAHRVGVPRGGRCHPPALTVSVGRPAGRTRRSPRIPSCPVPSSPAPGRTRPMTSTPLSVAVIGAGMAGRTHANAWRQAGTVYDLGLPPVRLAAIADAHLPFAEDAAARYGYEEAVGDWRDVAEDDSIDIVSIVVGNALHREIAEAMAAAGKHVLCEKPLAGTLEDAEAMAALEQEHPDLVLATGYTFRRNAGVAMLAKLAADGTLGEVAHLDGRYWCDYGADENVPMAWRYRGPMGSGALGDVGSHLVDSAELILGPLVEVSGAQLTQTIP